MQSTSLGPPRIVGLHKRSAARFVPKSYVVYRRQPFVDVARLLGSTRQALVQASQHLNGGGTGNGNATGSVDQDGRAQRMPQPLRAIASQQGAREPSTLKTVVAQVDRLESIQPTDSMDGFASDYSDFSGEDELTSTSYGSQERAGAYSYNKSHYEVLRLDGSGRTRKFYVRRRDLLREYRLQPRDLRRIDPTIDFTKTSPSITIKENVLLLCLGGVRAIVTAEKALLFEPPAPATRRFIETVVPHLESKAEQRGQAGGGSGGGGIGPGGASQKEFANAPHTEYMARFYAKNSGGAGEAVRAPPFELEVLEGALVVATGRLDAEMVSVTARVQELLTRLPNDINPVSLEELRRVKAALVELENKADTLRNMLEELMDDEDELRELNLSSRPRREERRRQRERERLERELERAREIKEELEERLEEDEAGGGGSGGTLANSGSGGPGGRMMPGKVRSSTGSMSPLAPIVPPPMPAHYVDPSGEGYASWTGGAKGPILGGMPGPTGFLGVQGPGSLVVGGSSPPSAQRDARQERLAELRAKFDRERLAELRSKFGWGPGGAAVDGSGGGAGYSGYSGGDGGGRERGGREAREGREGRASRYTPAASREAREAERTERLERMRMARAGGPDDDTGDWISRLEQQLEGSEEDIQEAQEALEEMVEQEEEEQELEEVEDLMEYYLQRASAAQSEAERLLAGARDLEESIGVSLSARRYEVNRLELTLSIGSFAAALGAMIAGIFGMNMKSMLELSVASFWGVSAAIVVGCTWVFVAIMRYTRAKRIL